MNQIFFELYVGNARSYFSYYPVRKSISRISYKLTLKAVLISYRSLSFWFRIDLLACCCLIFELCQFSVTYYSVHQVASASIILLRETYWSMIVVLFSIAEATVFFKNSIGWFWIRGSYKIYSEIGNLVRWQSRSLLVERRKNVGISFVFWYGYWLFGYIYRNIFIQMEFYLFRALKHQSLSKNILLELSKSWNV